MIARFPHAFRVSAFAMTMLIAGCSRPAPDATADGVVRLWIEKMETAESDPPAMKEAYALLGPRARANLKERAERASRSQGRRYEPYEMLAEGRFGLRFRPKSMTSKVDGNDALVEVRGDAADERAIVRCTREGAVFRIEPELPELLPAARREGSGP